jgi:hypothetical protein
LADFTRENWGRDDDDDIDRRISNERLGPSIDFDGLTSREIKNLLRMPPADGPERSRRKILKDVQGIPNPMSADADKSHTDRIFLRHVTPAMRSL